VFKKILVCLDGSELAEKVLPYAIEEAERFDSDLVLFRAISEPYLIGLALPGMPGVPINAARTENQELLEEKAAREYLKSIAEKLEVEKKLRVAYDTVIGTAGPAIVEYCQKQEIELIAIATHGRSGPGRVIIGSVADYVIRHTGLPILLIRPIMEKSR
jgi:nucleotide-binding universal stress UspA family protein